MKSKFIKNTTAMILSSSFLLNSACLVTAETLSSSSEVGMTVTVEPAPTIPVLSVTTTPSIDFQMQAGQTAPVVDNGHIDIVNSSTANVDVLLGNYSPRTKVNGENINMFVKAIPSIDWETAKEGIGLALCLDESDSIAHGADVRMSAFDSKRKERVATLSESDGTTPIVYKPKMELRLSGKSFQPIEDVEVKIPLYFEINY